jgi:Holliday junction resolvase
MAKLKHPKAKGTRLENQVVLSFAIAGFDSKRCWGSNGESCGLPKEVDVVAETDTGPFYIQCKSTKALASKYKPGDTVDAVVFKENRGDMYIMLRLDDYLYQVGTREELGNSE